MDGFDIFNCFFFSLSLSSLDITEFYRMHVKCYLKQHLTLWREGNPAKLCQILLFKVFFGSLSYELLLYSVRMSKDVSQ